MAKLSAPREVWVISEGHAGHTNQSLGLTDALGRLRPLQVKILEARMTLRGGLRPLLRRYLQTGLPVPESVLRTCYRFGPLPEGRPDLLVSSGGKSVPFGRVMARRLEVPYVFCGPPHPYPPEWFDLILSPLPVAGHAGVILTDLLLTRVTPHQTVQAARDLFGTAAGEGGRLGAVLVGGASRSCLFGDSDWRDLAAGLNRLAREDGWQWLLTTSRRTGARAENILRENLDPAALFDAAWWQEAPRKVVQAYLGRCEAVLVTRDSLTMISEAVASGKPTVAVAPARTRDSAYLDAVLEPQLARHRLASLTCAHLAAVPTLLDGLQPSGTPPADACAPAVLARLTALAEGSTGLPAKE